MKKIMEHKLSDSQAAIWWLGQAGYVLRVNGLTVVIDPYLSDSGANGAPEFNRLYPAPITPDALKADIIIITHNHADHLDPETIAPYRYKDETWFVAPWLAAAALVKAGVASERIIVVNAGQTHKVALAEITGVFALPTGTDVLDTTGYLVKFENGRSIYHTSDTQFHPLVVDAAPASPDIMLVPINGKWGNPGPEQAALFTASVKPKFVFPNHYDTMALNAENPEVFKWFCEKKGLESKCIIAERMVPFTW
ncbi:MAG: MBL fold metallo-hydrolase [Chitinophagaceae bacterium]|nr:MAG: MBL fold metallo-hydrolase [Chitinophagaceae bacterium]